MWVVFEFLFFFLTMFFILEKNVFFFKQNIFFSRKH